MCPALLSPVSTARVRPTGRSNSHNQPRAQYAAVIQVPWNTVRQHVPAAALRADTTATDHPRVAIVWRDKEAWKTIIAKDVLSFQDLDPQQRLQAAVELASITAQPDVLADLGGYIVESGAIDSLLTALKTEVSAVKCAATCALADLARSNPHIRACIPAVKVIPELVAIAQTRVNNADQVKGCCTQTTAVLCSAVALLGMLAKREPLAVAAAGAIPALVNLLSVDVDSRVCIDAARALWQLAEKKRPYQDAIADAGAIEKLVAMLDSNDLEMQVAAANAVLFIMKGNKDIIERLESNGVATRLLRKCRHVGNTNAVLNRVLKAVSP